MSDEILHLGDMKTRMDSGSEPEDLNVIRPTLHLSPEEFKRLGTVTKVRFLSDIHIHDNMEDGNRNFQQSCNHDKDKPCGICKLFLERT